MFKIYKKFLINTERKFQKKKKIEISINRGLSYEKMEKYIERKSY